MKLEFAGEASETFQNMLHHIAGYAVEVEVSSEDATHYGATFDAKLIGPDPNADWHDAVLVQEFDDQTGDGKGEPFSVRVSRITVY